MIAVALCPIVCGAAFKLGRDRAYREIDAESLAIACRPLAAGLTGGRYERLVPSDHAYAELPAAIRALHPETVFVGRAGVALHMDGGGIALQEGVVVFANPADRALVGYLPPLDSSRGVYRFSCDDVPSLVQAPEK